MSSKDKKKRKISDSDDDSNKNEEDKKKLVDQSKKIHPKNNQVMDLENNNKKNKKKESEGSSENIFKKFENKFKKNKQACLKTRPLTEQAKSDMQMFDPDTIPPNFKQAHNHYLAHKTGPEVDDNNLPPDQKNQYCPCCGFIINRQPLSIFCDKKEFSFLGSGYPLFFNFIQHCMIVLMIILAISGIYNLVTSTRGERCLSREEIDNLIIQYQQLGLSGSVDRLKNKECEKSWITTTSLANKVDRDDDLTIQRWLSFSTICVLIIYFHYFRTKQKKIDIDCDIAQYTAADYTIMVTHIKKGLKIDYDEKLKEFFEEKIPNPDGRQSVVNVNLGYDMRKFYEITKIKEGFVRKKQDIIAQKDNGKNFSADETRYDQQIKNCENQLDLLNQEFAKGVSEKFCGIAFVTFSTEDKKMFCLKKYQLSFLQSLKLSISEIFRFITFRKSDSGLIFENQKIYVTQAPEPSDVYWENLNESALSSFIRFIIGWAISLAIILGFSFGIYHLNLYQANINDDAKKSLDPSSSEGTRIKVIAAVISVSISLVIIVLQTLIPIITNFQNFKTRTHHENDIAIKLSIASFLTSSMITFIMTVTYFDNYYGNSGLINTQSIVFLSNMVVPPIISTINFPYIINKVKKYYYTLQQSKCTLTQLEANKLYENPPFSISKCYSQVIFTMFFTCFYATIIPLGLVFSIIALFLYQLVMKFNLIHRNSVDFSVSSELSESMIDWVELSIVAFSASELVFTRILFGFFAVPSIMSVCLASFNFIVPSQLINDYLFKFKVSSELKTYDESKEDFDEDYPTCNPAYAELAKIEKWKNNNSK